jgi:glycosyltransferase involved in cell wall biosynthesis
VKILFVLEHFPPYVGGVEKLFGQLANDLSASGHTVRVLTTRYSPELPRHEKIGQLEIIRIAPRNRYLFTFLGFFFCYRYSRGFQLVHTTSYNAALPAWLIALCRRIPAIITFHEVWGRLWFRLPYLSLAERLLFYSYERFVLMLPFSRFAAVSGYTAASLRPYVPARKITRIYNGIDYSHPLFAAPQETRPPADAGAAPHYLFFGRLGVSKGLDILAGASSILSAGGFRHKITLVLPKVPAPMFRKVKASFSAPLSAGSASIVHSLPYAQLAELAKSCTCAIIPSYSEGFCFAAAEMSAMQVPLVHTAAGALAEVASGRQIAAKDLSPQALAQAMRQAAEGRWQYAAPKKFPIADTVAGYISLYAELLHQAPTKCQ